MFSLHNLDNTFYLYLFDQSWFMFVTIDIFSYTGSNWDP